MAKENVYIALIINNANVSNFSSYNSVISLFNSTYPNNKLVIEKYLVDGSTNQTELSLNHFINKYPSGKRVSISTTSTILIASSNYFIKNNLNILSISISATSNLLKTIPNVLTYGSLNQYAVINDFMIYKDYQMEQIHVLYERNTSNDVFLKDTLELIYHQSLLLNITIYVSFLEQGKYDYNIKPKSIVIILGNTSDITNIYVTPQFLKNFPNESFILLTLFNRDIKDIFGNVPAMVQLPTNINYTTVSKNIYDAVKNNPDAFDFTIYPFYDILFVLNDFTTNGLEITKENYISINPYGSNQPAWLLNSYLSPIINSPPYGKYQYTFTKDVMIGNDKNLFLQYYDGGQYSLPNSYSIFKIVGITPNNPSLIEYDDADYYEIYDSNNNLVCVRYNSNITNFIDNLNIGTTIATRFIYKYNDDGYFTTLHRLFPFDMEIPKVNATMSKQPIKLKYIVSQQTSTNSVNIKMSALINTLKRINLNRTSVSGQDLIYSITQLPIYGTLFYISNGVYDYLPISNNIDTIVYNVRENNMISLPGTVTIYNYSKQDVDTILKNQGSCYFQKITFDGNKWQFGTVSSPDFFQYTGYNQLGNHTFHNYRRPRSSNESDGYYVGEEAFSEPTQITPESQLAARDSNAGSVR